MDEMHDRLGSILNDPQMMQTIMNMAKSLSSAQDAPREAPPPPPAEPSASMPIDPALIQKIAGLVQQSGIDTEQKALLNALHPYLSTERIRKLERAMRAAKTAKLASGALGAVGLHF